MFLNSLFCHIWILYQNKYNIDDMNSEISNLGVASDAIYYEMFDKISSAYYDVFLPNIVNAQGSKL